MNRAEARSSVIREWDRWIKTQDIDPEGPTGKNSLKFFLELQDRRSPLLDFDPRGQDRWQLIHYWLLSGGRVSGLLTDSRRSRQYRRMNQARSAQAEAIAAATVTATAVEGGDP